MPKWTVLLDVDDTSAISNKYYGKQDGGYRYNDVLFEALKACQCTDVYLFTSFDLSSISPDLETEAIGVPSRLKLVQYLESQGFRVQGVMVPLDVAFNQGVGAYYEKVVKPFEAHVLNKENLRDGKETSAYKTAVEQEIELLKRAQEQKIKPGDKGRLYQYFVETQRNSLLYSHCNIIFVDDRKIYLQEVKRANQPYGYPLCLIEAKPENTVDVYQKQLSEFQYGLEKKHVEDGLTRINAQTDIYSQLKREFDSILAFPNLRALEHFSFKITYFLMQHEKLENLYPKIQNISLDNPLLEDKGAKRLIESIKTMPGLRELSEAECSEAVLYGLDKPYNLSIEIAKKILTKINSTGNSRVGRVNNVFFKQGADFNLVEQAVYQLSRLFAEGIVTPTRLLLLKVPDEDIYDLQASLGVGVDVGIEAIGLDDLCHIFEVVRMLKQNLGEALFCQDFAQLLTNKYYVLWLSENHLAADLSWEQQCQMLLDLLLKLPQEHWPEGLKEYYATAEPQKSKLLIGVLSEAFQGKKEPLRLLALLTRYPALNKRHLNDLIICSDVFECLRFLYPNLEPESVLKEVENLFNYIPKENLSAHLLLEILTEPQDHKGDNFKVQFQRNSQGNLRAPLEIIAIDNDAAIEGIFKTKGKEQLLLVKSLLLANSVFLDETISEVVRERFLSLNSKVALIQWVEVLNCYYEPYFALKENGIISKGLARRLLIKQASLDFIERLSARFERIQNCLKQGPITHKMLLLQTEPLLGRSYVTLMEHSASSQSVMRALYNKRKPVLLDNVLKKEDLEQLEQREMCHGKTIRELIETLASTKPLGYRSYVEILAEYVSNSLTFDHPLQAHALALCMRLTFYHITLPAEGLVLTPQNFIKIYRQAPQNWIHFIRTCPKISVQLSLPISLNHPMILYHAFSEPEGPLLVEVLLACGVSANQARIEDGLTPLHFATRFYPDCIPVLIEAGAETECKDARGMTPLEMAMRFNYHRAVILLLQAGAGQDLMVLPGLDFIKAHQALCHKLCNSLLSANVAIAWELALERVSQEKETAEAVSIMGIQGKRYLCSEIYNSIFKNGLTFPKENTYGVRSVTAIRCTVSENIHVGLHLKQYPELPGREIMVQLLAQRLFGFITPSVALWRFSKRAGRIMKREVAYPVLASRSIEGKNLLEVIENPIELKLLDKRSIFEAMILAMMINPEDGRADNYIVQPFSKGNKKSFRIISIDNDHAFVRPVAFEKSGTEGRGSALQVKTILYCLDEMQEALPSEMVKQLLAHDPYKLLNGWLIELKVQQEKIDTLFNKAEKTELLRIQKVYLNIMFRFSIIEDIYQKLCRLQTVLRENPKITLFGILRAVIPELWIRYASVFNTHNSPLERFNELTKGAFETRVVKQAGKSQIYTMSTANAAQVLQMTKKIDDKETKEEEQEDTAETALSKFQKLYEECQAITEIAKELQQGVIERFKKLPSTHQEKILNGDEILRLPGIDFNKMQDVKRPMVLSVLNDISLRVLKIKNFKTLTDNQLNTLLKRNKGLLVLSLEGCSKLTNGAATIIERNCSNLEKLFIHGLNWSEVRRSLPALRVLDVQNCQYLLFWEAALPSVIERLYFKNCEMLNRVGIYSSKLREIQFNHCPQLPETSLSKLSTQTHVVTKVELEKCSSIENSNFFKKYPKLLNLPLHDCPSGFAYGLDAGITLSLKELGISVAMMQPGMMAQLQGHIIRWQTVKRTLFSSGLLLALKDKNIDVQKAACIVISKLPLAREDRDCVLSPLLNTLDNPSVELRNCVVQALVQLLSLATVDYPILLSVLLKDLDKKDRVVKCGVCEVLLKLPMKSEYRGITLGIFLKLIEDAYPEVRDKAAQLLLMLQLSAEDTSIVLPVFLRISSDQNVKIRSYACVLLSKLVTLETDKKIVISTLEKMKNDPVKEVRDSASNALLQVSSSSVDAERAGLSSVNNQEEVEGDIKSRNEEAQSSNAVFSKDATGQLLDVLKKLTMPEKDLRDQAVQELLKIPLSTENKIVVVLPALLPLFQEKYSEIRILAVNLLLNFYPSTQELIETNCQKFKKAYTVFNQGMSIKPVSLKESATDVCFDTRLQQISLSGVNRHYGLLVLALGIKQACNHNRDRKQAITLPNFFETINVASFKRDIETQEITELCVRLCEEMSKALLIDSEYKNKCYRKVVEVWSAFLEDMPLESEMQTWLKITHTYRIALKTAWIEQVRILEKDDNPGEATTFVERELKAHWDAIYQQYCMHIKMATENLSADELGCLARYWHIGLKIQFSDGAPYITQQAEQPNILEITLCKPSSMRWNVMCESGIQFGTQWNSAQIKALITGIENVEYKDCILAAMNDEEAYTRSEKDCSYIQGVLFAIQEVPKRLVQQGKTLSMADLVAAQELSKHFEQGFFILSAKQIYFLKKILSETLFEPSAVNPVVEWVEESRKAQDPLSFGSLRASVGGAETRPVIPNTRTLQLHEQKCV